MRNRASRLTVASLIDARLAVLGASHIPAPARLLIEAELLPLVVRVVRRRISAPTVGRAVARALCMPAGTRPEGSKGDVSPLASSAGRTPGAEPRVAGPTTKGQTTQTGDTSNRGNSLPEGARHD